MPQYTSSETTPSGFVVSAVLNTEENVINYTITTPNGITATSTYDATKSGNTTGNIRNLYEQLRNNGWTGGLSLSNTLSGVSQNVVSQADQAKAASAATGTPVPAEPSPPAPVPAAVNPTPTPATPSVENTTPEPVTDPNIATPEVNVYEPLQEPPNPDPNEYNEFAGLDAAVAANENALQEPPLLSDEEVNDYFNQQQNEQIENDNNSATLDDGSDPYFSNGESTIPTVESQDPGSPRAIGIAKSGAQSTATNQDSASFQKAKDWRVRISLAPNAKYLYKGISKTEAGILAPLQDTDGVIFPYTPNVSVSYVAGYDPTEIAHSNYKVYQYKGSSVDSITITGDFTAQDTTEANYLLAVIHFFRSVTKMFYGQDQNPKNGVPPPLCYLSGFGTYQFDNHPMAITNFTYATPTDVDYIRAGSQTNMPGQSVSQQSSVLNTIASAASAIRLLSSNLTVKAPNFQSQNSAINSDATYVPTKISISITAVPVVSRNDISNKFSLKEYASGKLLQGSKRSGGGIW